MHSNNSLVSLSLLLLSSSKIIRFIVSLTKLGHFSFSKVLSKLIYLFFIFDKASFSYLFVSLFINNLYNNPKSFIFFIKSAIAL